MIQLVNAPQSTSALIPASHANSVEPTVFDLFRSCDASSLAPPVLSQLMSQITPQTLHRPIPAPEPNPEPNPAPDAVWQGSQPYDNQPHNNISPADWDELFHAVQARLEHCVSDALLKTPQLALQDRHEVTKAAVLECVAAMTQLHASLTLERKKRADAS